MSSCQLNLERASRSSGAAQPDPFYPLHVWSFHSRVPEKIGQSAGANASRPDRARTFAGAVFVGVPRLSFCEHAIRRRHKAAVAILRCAQA
eukprot:6334412-Prymnesium_polylepis.1